MSAPSVEQNYRRYSTVRLWRPVLWLAGSLFLGTFATEAFAHNTGESYVFLSIEADKLTSRVEITTNDINKAFGSHLPVDGSAQAGDLAPIRDRLIAYIESRLSVRSGATALSLTNGRIDLFSTSFAQFAQITHEIQNFDRESPTLTVEYRGLFDVIPEHRAFVVIENDWNTNTFGNEAQISGTFSADEPSVDIDLTNGSVMQGFLGLVEMGMHHIWIGIDHVLFLMALLLPSAMRRTPEGWQPETELKPALIRVIKIVTTFTVAHTITLSLAALNVIDLPSRLVESVIAVSIAVVAIDILFPVFRNWVYSVVLAFGLFHGFGFASVLGEMAIPSSYKALSLLGFNVGVEIGQLAIVCVAVPLLFVLGRSNLYRRFALPAAAMGLIMISGYWFVERALNIDLPAGEILRNLTAAAGL